MKTVKAIDAQLSGLVGEASRDKEPIAIESNGARAVLVSFEEWSAIQETLCLTSIPGMRESIQEGMSTPTDECSDTVDW
ncbi:MAG TPA: type II toxin-antitoxin system Phd/YefM family antitoxin [Thermoanaerobaculia bacterium]|nr:type II toxin-antitoxin system Phd/YefM family antitoxin [Thermoanaerobaculia bacterium]